ncbi:MAG: hypothetical protein HY319_06205, partial [Armatimonadetes bacterium]|nr:hypothetical protein [Armatimonadota bacterium]
MRISGNLVTGQLGAHAGGKGIPGCTHNCASCARNGRAIDHAISKGVLTDKVLNGLGSVASGIQLEGKPSPSVWKRMARDLHQNGTLVDGDVKRLRDFAKDVRSRRAEIKRSVLASMEEEVDPRLVRQLDKTDRFLLGYQAIERSLAEATARNTIRALVGCGFGPTNVVAAYAAAAQCSRRHIRELVEQLQRVERGESESVIAGNQVEPVHGEKLWQAKMHLLDEAIASAEAGHPVEIDAQYYELTNAEYLGKLARAAKAGCPLRINVDPTRVREGGEGQQSLNIDDSPKTFRSLIQLAGIPGADVGVSVYPVNQQLGGPTQLMHRKLLRVGEKVLLGGMNGNSGSGENVDAGWLIQGPAARALVEGFARDVDQSLGATNDELYSQQALIRVYSSKLTLTPHGLANLLDSLGTAPPFEHIPYQPSYSYLQRKAGEAGVNLQSLLAMTDEELQKALNSNSRQKLPISEEGKKLLAQEMRLALQATRHPKNVRSLKSIKLPDGKPVGQTAVAIGDRPLEREALLLHAINTAEKFIYVPAFVITRPVAQALAARRSQLHREGKEIDVRVIADAGLYPFGGTPNEYGVLPLEDAGIPVRWALLPNSSRFHDRKIHAKQILTDKMEFFGSTNL